jgi:hypothetical protein
MDVIGDSADLESGAPHLVESAREATEQIVADGLREERLAVFGAENEVDDVTGED